MRTQRAGGRLGGAVTAVAGMGGRAANQLIALFVTLLAARWLTPATFGEYSIAAALVTFSRMMLYAGAFEYLLKAPRGNEATTECLVINVALAAALGGALAVLAMFTQFLFHSSEVGRLLVWMAPSSLISAMANWQEAQLLRSGRLKTYYGVTTFAEVMAALVTVTLILLGWGLVALIAQIYSRLFVLMITYRVLQTPGWSEHFSIGRVRQIGRWSSARYGSTLVGFLSGYSADLLLGMFLSPAATGLYRASSRMVTGVADLITNPTRLTAVTVFSRRAADGLEGGTLWPRIAAASTFLGWTALAGLAAISSSLAPLVLGDRWRAAGPVIAILCIQRAFTLVDGITGPLLVAYSHVRALFGVQLTTAIVGVALLALLARFGVTAAALSSAFAAALSACACAIISARSFPALLSGVPRVLPVALGAPAATGAAAYAFGQIPLTHAHGPLVHGMAQVGAGAAAFAAVAFALRRGVMDALHALDVPARAALGPTPSAEGVESPRPAPVAP